MLSTELHRVKDSRLTMSAFLFQIIAPNHLLQIQSDLGKKTNSTSTAENQKENFILKKEFLCTMTQLLPCHFAVVVNLAWIMHLRGELC